MVNEKGNDITKKKADIFKANCKRLRINHGDVVSLTANLDGEPRVVRGVAFWGGNFGKPNANTIEIHHELGYNPKTGFTACLDNTTIVRLHQIDFRKNDYIQRVQCGNEYRARIMDEYREKFGS